MIFKDYFLKDIIYNNAIIIILFNKSYIGMSEICN